MNRGLALVMAALLCILCACGEGGGTASPIASPNAHATASAAPSIPESTDTTAAPTGSDSPAPITGAYQTITAEQAMLIMDADADAVLLDVRTGEEYSAMRIEGALLLPDYDVESRAEVLLTHKDAPIMVYCRTGRRSAAAARTLLEMGYANVYDLGGILDWPYETVSD